MWIDFLLKESESRERREGLVSKNTPTEPEPQSPPPPKSPNAALEEIGVYAPAAGPISPNGGYPVFPSSSPEAPYLSPKRSESLNSSSGTRRSLAADLTANDFSAVPLNESIPTFSLPRSSSPYHGRSL